MLNFKKVQSQKMDNERSQRNDTMDRSFPAVSFWAIKGEAWCWHRLKTPSYPLCLEILRLPQKYHFFSANLIPFPFFQQMSRSYLSDCFILKKFYFSHSFSFYFYIIFTFQELIYKISLYGKSYSKGIFYSFYEAKLLSFIFHSL